MMKKTALLLLAVAIFVSLAGCGSKDSRVLAKVDDQVITVKEFNDKIDRLPSQYKDIISSQKRKFLDDIIMEELLYKKAINDKIDKERETQDVIKEAAKKIIIARLIEKEVEKKVSVTDDEARRYYDEHSEEFLLPERWRASHILVDTLTEANDIETKLKSGASFEELAKEYSKDPTAKIGGDIGYFSKGQLVADFEKECFVLKVGEISQPVKTQFGYHIIKLTDKKDPSVQDFEGVKELIKRELARNKKKDILAGIMADLKKKAKISINEKVADQEFGKGETGSGNKVTTAETQQ